MQFESKYDVEKCFNSREWCSDEKGWGKGREVDRQVGEEREKERFREREEVAAGESLIESIR